ncbi:MAG: hypothetical protein RSD27_04310 [Ruthenibacterium sp.]
MNGNCYFENHPFEAACTEIRMHETAEDIVELSVQCMCNSDELEMILEKWEMKLRVLLGSEKSSDTVRVNNATSVLKKFSNNAIVRIFIDASGKDCSENFEIVTKKALYVWKPDSCPQAHISTGDGNRCICTQKYSSDLEVL